MQIKALRQPEKNLGPPRVPALCVSCDAIAAPAGTRVAPSWQVCPPHHPVASSRPWSALKVSVAGERRQGVVTKLKKKNMLERPGGHLREDPSTPSVIRLGLFAGVDMAHCFSSPPSSSGTFPPGRPGHSLLHLKALGAGREDQVVLGRS